MIRRADGPHPSSYQDVKKTVKNVITKTNKLADDRVIEIETGNLAKQADGAAVVKM